jgi:micrococcal nuclease
VLGLVIGGCQPAELRPTSTPGLTSSTVVRPVAGLPSLDAGGDEAASAAAAQAVLEKAGPTGKTTKAKVVRIVDGDTIVVAYGGKQYKVRYIGIDSPETVDPSSPVQWMGPQASAANKKLVAGKDVVLEKDVSETDQYGRLLRYVWLKTGTKWLLVNFDLVRRGFASAATYPPDVKYVDDYVAAEGAARVAAVGLWGPEPEPTVAPEPTQKPTSKPAAKPKPQPTKKPSNCHPSYIPCLPIVDDLNCPDVRAMGKAPVRVVGPDDYRLDADHDGIGCE